MSATDENVEVPGREIAYRLFAAEYDDASVSYAESDEERAPNYVVSPTGARLNRLFVVGTLTEVTAVNDEMVRARVVDPTGAFVVYAGQYQPDELAALESIDPPAFVAVTGKARTFEPDDGDEVYTSIRPESIATVDADTRDRWVVSAAEDTIDRIGTYATVSEADRTSDADREALAETLRDAGVDPGTASGIPLAREHYGTTPSYLAAVRDRAVEAVEVVAGEREQVGSLERSPDDDASSGATFASLAGYANVDPAVLESAVGGETAGTDHGATDVTDRPVDAETDADSEAVGTASAAGTATATATAASSASDDEDPAGTASGVSELESESDAEPADESTEPSSEAHAPTEREDESASAAAETADNDDDDDDGLEQSPDAESAEADATETEPSIDDDGGMYEMDPEEREQLEEEFGAEFTTGTEVEEPGEAGIDVPEPDDLEQAGETESDTEEELEGETDAGTEASVDDDLGAAPTSGLDDGEPDTVDETDSEDAADAGDEEPTDVDDTATDTDTEADSTSESIDPDEVDLEEYVVDTMADLDDGDGADRSALVETVSADLGVEEATVEDAIQDALMGGQCYEPDDETLKPI
ncbi:hypothetical protein [Halobiforma nitratireducens]|uniref:Rpa-associated protein n=1 Tax=Halobiforma nitratireducens JCM 10879 TaxID=1227454 RepID=M0M137_9EURY|nr:hypothetical protein [Halobiforma nitratireducens]EMA39502.1 hypothetical protein C446_08646 [Halobiforma nitratireducens JCM 10879]